jgi:hypothetical protein
MPQFRYIKKLCRLPMIQELSKIDTSWVSIPRALSLVHPAVDRLS